jgi:hypothetical protein
MSSYNCLPWTEKKPMNIRYDAFFSVIELAIA